MASVLGLNCKLYRNTGTYGSPTWNEITNVRDVTLNLTKGEADVTVRGGSGWRLTKATLKEAAIDFEMIWDSADDDFTAIKNAWVNGTAIEFLVLDGSVSVSGNQGLRATCDVVSFSRGEALEEAVKASVSLKPAYSANAPEWYTVA